MGKSVAIIGGTITSIAIISVLFFTLNIDSDIPPSELIVTNGHNLETVGEITTIQKSSEFSLIQIFENKYAV